MGPIKPHSNEIDFCEDDGEDSTVKFVIEDEESEILPNHGNHDLQDITFENLEQLFQSSKPSDAFFSEQEDLYQLILDIEKSVLSFSEKFDEICSTVNSFEHGHNYQQSDLIKLQEGCKLCLKEWNQLLEKLLGIDLEEFQIVEKSKRENLVNQINSLLDRAKKLLPTIETRKNTTDFQQGM